jgi:hypothetical protein
MLRLNLLTEGAPALLMKKIEILDLGAGSRVNKSNLRKISTIARNAEKPAKFGRLFHRLIRRFQPQDHSRTRHFVGTDYLIYGQRQSRTRILITFEGCPETAKKAQGSILIASKADNIEIVLGNIDETLPQTLKRMNKVLDFAYFDANHRFEPTVQYFEDCLPYIQNDSVFIFDDIYWSEGMTRAWEHIKAHPRVTLTVDLFWIGLVFFRTEQVKEDFVLRF